MSVVDASKRSRPEGVVAEVAPRSDEDQEGERKVKGRVSGPLGQPRLLLRLSREPATARLTLFCGVASRSGPTSSSSSRLTSARHASLRQLLRAGMFRAVFIQMPALPLCAHRRARNVLPASPDLLSINRLALGSRQVWDPRMPWSTLQRTAATQGGGS
ncbi:hypothetical protein BJY59DRAFT_113647 [Rhodotorula toruloides]